MPKNRPRILCVAAPSPHNAYREQSESSSKNAKQNNGMFAFQAPRPELDKDEIDVTKGLECQNRSAARC